MIVDMPRVLMILGSGETSPAMVTPHQQLFARLGSTTHAMLLDSPYGFQENADELTERTIQYFRDRVGRKVEAVTFRSSPVVDPAGHAIDMARLRAARWIFAGPGSPSYALRTWAGSAVPDALHAVLREGGAVVFASAAALTLGLVTVPVYEIYKVGSVPQWLDGLDIFGRATGLRAAIVPHWNNAEGGTHDTRFCYLGERRLRMLEDLLPDDSFVLGIDEHTGFVIDLDTGAADVVGRGSATVRSNGREWSLTTGSSTTLAEIAERAEVEPSFPAATETAGLAPGAVAALEQALEQRDVPTALALVAEFDRTASTTEQRRAATSYLARCIAALGGSGDVTATVTPYVELLLAQRARARDDKRWSDSDAIRDGLSALGIEVRDGSDGVTWDLNR
jgi:cyanophycinase-like exopeptidase